MVPLIPLSEPCITCDSDIHDCGICNSGERHTTEPQPIQWQPGWLMWSPLTGIVSIRQEDIERGKHNNIGIKAFTVPTRAQLAVPIKGTNPPVQAWAWEDASGALDAGDVRVTYSDGKYASPMRRDCALALGLDPMPAEQVEKMFNNVFPPEE